VNARNRVFLILGLLTIGSLIWYFVTVRPSGDLQLVGTLGGVEMGLQLANVLHRPGGVGAAMAVLTEG